MYKSCLRRTGISQEDISTGRDRNEGRHHLAWLPVLPLKNSRALFTCVHTDCFNPPPPIPQAQHTSKHRKTNHAQPSWEKDTMLLWHPRVTSSLVASRRVHIAALSAPAGGKRGTPGCSSHTALLIVSASWALPIFLR